MHATIGRPGDPPFPPTAEDRATFSAREQIRWEAGAVRESGHVPDDPPDSACWRHRTREQCVLHARRIAEDRETREHASLGLDVLVWMHARKRLRAVPHREFLTRFDPAGRWRDGATPAVGLARAAVLHHLPLAGREETTADLFAGAAFWRRICPAEREWMEAERRARLSFFCVERAERTGVRLRDLFGSMSGRRDVWIPRQEIRVSGLERGATVFARVVAFRGAMFLGSAQADSTLRAGVLDAALPARTVRRSGRPLRSRTGMVNALFEAWEEVAGPLPVAAMCEETGGRKR